MSEETPPRRSFRWQALFQRAIDPVFVLDRRRRLLFVNAAWERLTGYPVERVHGLSCRRPRPVSADASAEEQLAHLLTPPPEVSRGGYARTRRLYLRPVQAANAAATPGWWDVEFFSLRQGTESGCLVIGRVMPVPPVAAERPLPPLPERIEGLRARHAARFRLDLLDGQTAAQQRVVARARLALAVATPVLLLGEPGSGKRTLARVLHYQGAARERGLACLDARRLPAGAVADVLFADRAVAGSRGPGTIYLAGADHLPRDVQMRLNERIARGVGPRLLVGIEPPVQDSLSSGRFVDELYWQVSTLTIDLPPLRQRSADLPQLVERLLAEPDEEGVVSAATLTPAVWDLFRGYAWPGNLAELRRVLSSSRRRARAAAGGDGIRIDLPHLPSALRITHDRNTTPPVALARPIDLEAALLEAERRLIGVALARAGGNRSQAARLLGIHRPRLLRRMQALGLTDAADAPEEE